MPIYEYRCSQCEKIIEEMQKFSDPPLTECPHCKGSLSRLLSRTSFQLKGSGWYNTDYKKTGAPASTTAGSEPKPATETTPAPAATDTAKKPCGSC